MCDKPYFHLGSLVEFDPLCLPLDNDMKSINVISLDESEVKAPVLLREIRPLEEHEFELLRPLSPQVRHLFYYLFVFFLFQASGMTTKVQGPQ